MKQNLAILILLSFIFSCSDKAEKIVADECSGANCTDIYIAYGIRLKDKSGSPVKLDEYQTVKVSTGEEIDLAVAADLSIQQQYGAYPIIGDGEKKFTSKDGEEFRFTGKMNGDTIVTKSFVIGSDCCHIKLLKGELDVVIGD